MQRTQENYIRKDLEINGLKEIRRASSTNNVVSLCEDSEGNFIIAKTYGNKYFQKQAEYESKVYDYLKSQNFVNISSFQRTIKLDFTASYCNLFENIPYQDLSKNREGNIETLITNFVEMIEKLHKIRIPWGIIDEHPQSNTNPINFLRENTLQKLKNRYGYVFLDDPLDFPKTDKKNLVFSHRDPNYKHVLKGKEILYLVDFEDCGAFPKEVDFASFLKDMIEYGANTNILYQYLDKIEKGASEIWPYLIRAYLIDFAYLSNTTKLNFSEFDKIVKNSLNPLSGLEKLVRSHEINTHHG